jgi:hypothetical protein
MRTSTTLESLARRLPPPLARSAKRLVVRPRYAVQARACRRGFRQFGGRYPQNVLFVAGLPKSGTTWLEEMLASFPGFGRLLIPDVASYELSHGESHDYQLPPDIFDRFRGKLVVTKMHVNGSRNNVAVLRSAGVRYVVLYRDLRDVAVSHVFYVRQTPWHAEYPVYAGRSTQECLSVFADRTLLPFAEWIRSWRRRADPEAALVVRYEDILADPHRLLARVARHFQLDAPPGLISGIVDRHAFHRLSGGRMRGEQDSRSFFRKGIAGDWRTHFSAELIDLYRERLGDYLDDLYPMSAE